MSDSYSITERALMEERRTLNATREELRQALVRAETAERRVQIALTGDLLKKPAEVKLKEAEADNASLRAALEFYAARRNWIADAPHYYGASHYASKVERDCGERARAALGVNGAASDNSTQAEWTGRYF